MEINPLSSYLPGPGKRNNVNRVQEETHVVQQETYVGPNLEVKKNKLAETTGVREKLVSEVQKELADQKYFTEERLKGTIDALLASL
jgi:predicted regulator of amino acid metabolism with ACT domain